MGTRRKLSWVALLYFAEGLPFGMVLDNFPVYFRLHGVSLGLIGALSLLRTPWWAKVFWSPLVDQIGERRQWIQGALIVMAAALLAVAALPVAPIGALLVLALFTFTTAAATQDVAIDAYTIELLVPGEEGVANGVRVSAYRAALVFAGGVLVALAGRAGWPTTFAVAAVGLLALAFAIGRSPLTDHHPQPPRVWARSLQAWVSRPGAIPVFLFVLLYKLDTNAIGPMVKPFWVDRGLSLRRSAWAPRWSVRWWAVRSRRAGASFVRSGCWASSRPSPIWATRPPRGAMRGGRASTPPRSARASAPASARRRSSPS